MLPDFLPAILVTLTAVFCVWLGTRLGRGTGRGWLMGLAVPLLVLLLTAAALNVPQLCFVAPFSWLASGSGRWLSVTMSAGMTLGLLSQRVQGKGQRRALLMLAGVIILRAGTLPFLGPTLAKAELESLSTQTDGRGVCLQSTPYNCGPASAVTAVRALELDAEEGSMGLLLKTDGVSGTADDTMAEKLRERYGPQGLLVEHRYLNSVDELKAWPVSIAVTRFNMFVDHYVAVLGFEGDRIVVGDPLVGRQSWSIPEFEEKWRHVAVLLRRVEH